jgi:uncharacterized protein (TIGR02391 family)
MVLSKKQEKILHSNVQNFVDQKQGFGTLKKSEQTKYLAYFFVRITGGKTFNADDIAPLFNHVGVSTPENVRDILNKMKGKGLIAVNGKFSFHRDLILQLDTEFKSVIVRKNDQLSVSELVNRGMHTEIVATSEKLFINEHFQEAIFNAFKRLEILVKKKANLNNLTGHPLMQKAFSANNPILKFNSLQSQTEKDEQQGMMELFAGAMLGIRNPKAHDDVIQKDPVKTLEYLAFASLLCKRLDEAHI